MLTRDLTRTVDVPECLVYLFKNDDMKMNSFSTNMPAFECLIELCAIDLVKCGDDNIKTCNSLSYAHILEILIRVSLFLLIIEI